MSRGTTVADVEDGMLSLLQDPINHDIAVATVSLMAESSMRSTVTDVDSTVVVPHDPQSHQARAAAALEQAESRANQVPTEAESQVPLEQPIEEQDIPSTSQLENRSPDRMGGRETHPSGNKSSTIVDSSDIAIPFVPPQSICLCQAPARIPRPRNGK